MPIIELVKKATGPVLTAKCQQTERKMDLMENVQIAEGMRWGLKTYHGEEPRGVLLRKGNTTLQQSEMRKSRGNRWPTKKHLSKGSLRQCKWVKDEWTYQNSSGGNVTVRCSRPIHAANDKENDADKCFASVNYYTTPKFVCREGPDDDSQEIAAATRSISDANLEQLAQMEESSRENDSPLERIFQTGEGKEICISDEQSTNIRSRECTYMSNRYW